MRALLLDRLPNVATANKDDASRPLNGVKVNDAALVQALLDYGTYDAYYYIRESAENHKAETFTNSERLRPLDLGSLESLKTQAPDDLVLFTSSHHLAKFVPFRQFCGHPEWPICGLTHGLSSNTLIPSYSWNYFSAIERYDAIICTTSTGRRALFNIFEGLADSSSVCGVRGFHSPRMPVIPLGIDLSREKTWRSQPKRAEQGFVILCLGRFTASHKADLRPLIAGFMRSKELPDNCTLILAGDDTQSQIAPGLQEFAQSLPSKQKVVVMPDVSAEIKSALLHTADVFVAMSDTYQETFGLSVIEAMAAGLPVIAPHWDGYQDLVVHGNTGFLARTFVCNDTGLLNAVSMLVDPAFALGQRVVIDIDGMLHYLSLLSRHPEWAAQMGERGRERVKQLYSWDLIVPQYEALWADLLLKGKQRQGVSPVGQIGFMNYDRVFEGYAGQVLPWNTTVSLGPHIDQLLALRSAGELFSPSPIAGFSEDLDARVLGACRHRPEATVEELVRTVRCPQSGPSMAVTQISRLAKYGLLSIFPSPGIRKVEEELEHEFSTDCAISEASI